MTSPHVAKLTQAARDRSPMGLTGALPAVPLRCRPVSRGREPQRLALPSLPPTRIPAVLCHTQRCGLRDPPRLPKALQVPELSGEVHRKLCRAGAGERDAKRCGFVTHGAR